ALKKVLEGYPYYINAFLNLGVAYSEIGDLGKATAVYKKLIEIKPDYSKAHNNLGMLYLRKGMYDLALLHLGKAAELKPRDPVVHFNLGIIKLRMKRYEESAEEFEVALKYIGRRRELEAAVHRYLAGIYYLYLKDFERGIFHMRRYIELKPEDPLSRKFRGFLNGEQRIFP
ncbi:MAG: hypothetical protein DRI61_15310, partial [Chloroflexi bacterium]